MKKIILLTFLTLISLLSISQPANDNCANATSLTVGASLTCAQTTQSATLQGGECYTNYAGGSTEVSVWYRFTANNDSLILNFMQTNYPNCYPHIRVYGSFATGGGCLPACGSAIYSALQNGDPGSHILLTGLTIGNDYLVQVQGNHCGGANDGFTNFCINVAGPSSNAYSTNPSMIDACGTTFSGTTNGGYWQNGTSVGFNNLDNNGATTCGVCGAGDDTPFIINNISWFSFCSLTAGTWQVTVSGVGNCINPAPNNGVQASVFTGTTSALVNQGNSQNPIPIGGSWTSGTFTVNSGQCAWLMIDGFAGDACDYNVTLTNITGGCIVLPIELLYFSGVYNENGKYNELKWSVASQVNNDYYTIERSSDGINWTTLIKLDGSGNSSTQMEYKYDDYSFTKGINYYRLKQTDFDGQFEYFNIIAINNSNSEKNIQETKIYDVFGKECDESSMSPGMYIYHIRYKDNTIETKKVIKQ